MRSTAEPSHQQTDVFRLGNIRHAAGGCLGKETPSRRRHAGCFPPTGEARVQSRCFFPSSDDVSQHFERITQSWEPSSHLSSSVYISMLFTVHGECGNSPERLTAAGERICSP